MPSLLAQISSPYSAFEAWFYDTVIADAVLSLGGALQGRLLEALPDGARLLEVGCGGGQLALQLAALRPDVTTTGLDLSAAQVARARRRAARAGLGARISFVEGSALELPFADGSFDAVLSIASLKHWPDRRRGVAECVRVLRPGGRLAIVEADRGCHLDDARRFVDRFRLPPLLGAPALLLFRTFVAGQAVDLDEGRQLLAGLPLDEREVGRIPGTPGLLLAGRRGPAGAAAP